MFNRELHLIFETRQCLTLHFVIDASAIIRLPTLTLIENLATTTVLKPEYLISNNLNAHALNSEAFKQHNHLPATWNLIYASDTRVSNWIVSQSIFFIEMAQYKLNNIDCRNRTTKETGLLSDCFASLLFICNWIIMLVLNVFGYVFFVEC